MTEVTKQEQFISDVLEHGGRLLDALHKADKEAMRPLLEVRATNDFWHTDTPEFFEQGVTYAQKITLTALQKLLEEVIELAENAKLPQKNGGG